MNLQKHIWEGWRVCDFIEEIEPLFDMYVANSNSYIRGKSPFENKEQLKQWVMDNQPYYKKHIPEVYQYFLNKSNL